MIYLLISLAVLSAAFLLLLFGTIRLRAAEELTRTLAGHWTWDFGLADKQPTVVLRLWPADATSKNLLLTASCMQVAHDSAGNALQPVSERENSLKVHYSRLVFVSRTKQEQPEQMEQSDQYRPVIPAGHSTGR